jgi:hypothetical protein
MQLSIQRLEVYEQLFCPLGCQVEEDVDHLIECSKTKELVRDLPRQILDIINRYSSKNVSFFPSFYWLWNQQTNIKNNDINNCFSNNDPRLSWYGVVPKGLKEALLKVGVNSRQIQGCIDGIMIKIVKILSDRWKKRCKCLFA